MVGHTGTVWLNASPGVGWSLSPEPRSSDTANLNSVAQRRPFNLLVFQLFSIFSKGPKRLTFYSCVLCATELNMLATSECFECLQEAKYFLSRQEAKRECGTAKML